MWLRVHSDLTIVKVVKDDDYKLGENLAIS